MTVGSQKGKRVEDAKPLVRAEMIAAGQACAYWEPESKVVGRSGDECVVAFLDQWYLRYGADDWRAAVEGHVRSDNFDAYTSASQHSYEHTLGWLGNWACSRSFGLGTQLPWDEQFVIESLSDSTIYMAFYTISHLIQGEDNFDGSRNGPIGISASEFNDKVWDIIFCGGEFPEGCSIAEEKLLRLRREFE